MVVRVWGRPDQCRATKGDPDFGIGRSGSSGSRGRAVTMGSIDKYIFRTTPASLALIAGSLAGALRIARALERTLGGIDPMTDQGWMIPTILGFDSRMIPGFAISESPAFAIGESNARLPRLLGRPVTA
jgi:lipopolysaccharide export system permease protein